MHRHLILTIAATAVAVAGFVVGLHRSEQSILQPVADVPVAYAVCQPLNDTCNPGDTTKTSTLTASYRYPLSTQVEPADVTSWQIVASWWDNVGCTSYTETATVDVSWNGTSWALSNLNLPSGGIVNVTVCGDQTCQSAQGAHSSSYVLAVDVTDAYDQPGTGAWKNLRKVVYSTTSVPNGNEINTGPCTLGTARSPTGQSFQATDEPGKWLSGRCPYTCTVGGTSVTITYQ